MHPPHRTVSTALVVLLVAAAGAAAPAAADDCQEPADGVAVCETDADDAPDRVTVNASRDGVGSAEVTVHDHVENSFTSRSAQASAATDEGSPVGAREVAAEARCLSIQEDNPCHLVLLEAGTDDVGDGVGLRAECRDALIGSTPACGSADASAAATRGDESLEATARCGGVNPLGPRCPLEAAARLDVATREGDAMVFAGASVVSATVCAETPSTGFTCLP